MLPETCLTGELAACTATSLLAAVNEDLLESLLRVLMSGLIVLSAGHHSDNQLGHVQQHDGHDGI